LSAPSARDALHRTDDVLRELSDATLEVEGLRRELARVRDARALLDQLVDHLDGLRPLADWELDRVLGSARVLLREGS
jgi:hypothetical protein